MNGTEKRGRPRKWVKLLQPLLIAACLFLWLVLTPTGQLIHAVVFWKTLSPQEVNIICAALSIAAALVQVLLSRRTEQSNG
ncbi:hypothetical protein DLM86_17920 [Paenibacillus flagellatus]|uniref:Uncharacterized protein n=2 Tax=Paenibacillus flagellatus TaxID=2211139 RepID=A0A2V5K115_9BACL|nr:hypothetical protein DLM86_17920 [Paenibacillus flagellatus]